MYCAFVCVHQCVTGSMTSSDFVLQTMSSAYIRIEKLTPPTLHSTFYRPLFITSSWLPFIALNADVFLLPVLAPLIAPVKRASPPKSQSWALLALKCLSLKCHVSPSRQTGVSHFFGGLFSLFLCHWHCNDSSAGPHSDHAPSSPEKLLSKDHLVWQCGIKQVSTAGWWR